MKKKLFFIVFLIFGLNNLVNANENNCTVFKKFSLDYIKCKGSLFKDTTIFKSKNFVENTKKYQKKEWSKEKEKMNKIKDKVLNK